MLNKIYLEFSDIYQNAKYEVLSCPQIVIAIGENNEHLDKLLMRNGSQTAALLTAWNPEGKKVSQQENLKAMESLELALNEMKLPFLPGMGSDPKGAWKEESYLILGIALDQAESLGRQFQQNAFVWIEIGHGPRLVWP